MTLITTNEVKSFSKDNLNYFKKNTVLTQVNPVLSGIKSVKQYLDESQLITNRITANPPKDMDEICTDREWQASIKFEYNQSIDSQHAKNYVYLGTVNTSMLTHQGLTLDQDGNLLLIKGTSMDLIKGVYHGYRYGYNFSTAVVKLENNSKPIVFDALFTNSDGQLVGQQQKTNHLYSIVLAKKMPQENQDNTSTLLIRFAALHQHNIANLNFQLSAKDHISASFYLNNERLYLERLITNNHAYGYGVLQYDIQLPIKNNGKLVSAKRCANMLQLEIQNKDKTRIFYLDPNHINFHQCKAKHWSHKPPQNFISGIGNDPHEQYYSGQPFSSTRKGNFSSQHIPLLSLLVDKFRFSLKKAKHYYYEDNYAKSAKHIARGIDPGIEYLWDKGKTLISKTPSSSSFVSTKEKIFKQQQILAINQHNKTTKHLAATSHYLDSKTPLSQSMMNVLVNLKENDPLSFELIDEFGLFFGVAAEGIPFVTGWFAGVVALFKQDYKMVLVKKNDSIQFQFIHKTDRSLIGLVGTGQGLEDNHKLVQYASIDFVTVMPAEANLILVTHLGLHKTFKFELKMADVLPFFETLYGENNHTSIAEYVIDQAQVEKCKDTDFIVLVEAKSELRGQNGFMANDSTYLVLPRSALGARIATNLLHINNHQKMIIKAGSQRQDIHKQITVNLINVEGGLFRENKIMPIPMKPGYMGTNNVWCFPAPLTEETVNIRAVKSNFLLNSDTLMTSPQSSAYQAKSLTREIRKTFTESKNSGITYRKIYDAEKIKKIKLYEQQTTQFNRLVKLMSGSSLPAATTLDALTKQGGDKYKSLALFIYDIHEIAKSTQRNSLYKQSNLIAQCIYVMEPTHYKKLFNQYMVLVKKIHDKQKKQQTFNAELTELKKIQATLALKQKDPLILRSDDTNTPLFYLKTVQIIRDNKTETRLETLPLVILRGSRRNAIGLTQQIGIIQFDISANLSKPKIKSITSEW